jgi:hypothetical protein
MEVIFRRGLNTTLYILTSSYCGLLVNWEPPFLLRKAKQSSAVVCGSDDPSFIISAYLMTLFAKVDQRKVDLQQPMRRTVRDFLMKHRLIISA